MLLIIDDKRWQRRRRHQSTPVEASETPRIRPRRQRWRWVPIAWMVCLVNGLVSWVAATSVISQPFVLWEQQLQLNSTLGQPGRGNGVVLENDSTTVWLTTSSGIVRIVRNGLESIYVPPTKENVNTQCNSSISLYQDRDGLHFAVYAVVDVPYLSDEPITSRLLALSPTGHLRWIATVDGIIVGTPQIGASGKAVYVTHNAKGSLSGAYTAGKLSVFRDDLLGIGGEVPLQDAGAFGFANKEAPFSPLAVVSIATSSSLTDQVYWSEAWDNGQAKFGLMYHFNSSSYEVSAMSRTSSSSIVAPVLSMDGKSMYFGGRASTIYGWPQGRSFLMRPKWSQSIDPDGSLAIQNQLILSGDGTRIYALSAENTIACIEANTGNILWRVRNSGVALVKLRLANDDDLFSIQEYDGLITKYNALNGRVVSQFNCFDTTKNVFCLGAVEADFAVSNDGRNVYYADVSGRLVAIEFGDETSHPTITPAPTTEFALPPTSEPIAVTISPSGTPTKAMTLSPSESPFKTSTKLSTSKPSFPISYPTSTPQVVVSTPSPSTSSLPTPFPTSDIQLVSGMPTKSPSMLRFSLENLVSGGPEPTPSPNAPTSAAASPAAEPEFVDVNFPNIIAHDDDAMGSDQKPHHDSNKMLPTYSDIKPFAITLAIAVVMLFALVSVGVMLGRCCVVKRQESVSARRWREERQQRAKLLRRPSYREVV